MSKVISKIVVTTEIELEHSVELNVDDLLVTLNLITKPINSFRVKFGDGDTPRDYHYCTIREFKVVDGVILESK